MTRGAGGAAAWWGPRRGGALVSAVVAALLMAVLAVTAPITAHADSSPADPTDPATPTTVSADGLPTVQIDGVAWSQALVGDRVYVGGSFANARPAGAAPGTNQTPRSNLMAYDVTTGALVPSFAPVVNAQVRTVAVSPDQSRLYIGGSFTSVDGQVRKRIAAFDTATGALVANFAPPVNYDVLSIVATNSTVYAGGDFQSVGTKDRGYLAAFSAANGALLDWAPQAAGGRVMALAINPQQTKIAVGGEFTSLNGSSNPGYGLGMIDAVTGASLPMAANSVVRDATSGSGILSLSTDGTTLYGSGYTWKGGGNLEGVFGASWDGGVLSFVDDCHGDTYSTYPRGGALYAVGHTHYCGNIGGFPQTDPNWSYYRGLAFGTQPTGHSMREPYGYANFQGQPTSSLLTWFPSVNAGTYTGQGQGPWSISGNGQYVVMAGEFTKVNNQAQQGLVRFPAAAISPNAQGPSLFGATYPLNLSSTEAGQVRVNWSTNQDIDNDNLTYKVYRDVQRASGLVYQTSTRASFWAPYTMGFTDTGLDPGSTHQYRVAVTDPFGNIANSPWTTVTVASTGADSGYVKAVYASQPVDYWRMGETSGSTAGDRVGFTPVTLGSGVTKNVAGAIAGDADKAMTFDGTSSGLAYSTRRISPPNVFTLEGWFRTGSQSGGKLIGFGDKQSSSSTSYDRQLYVDSSGRLQFGVYNGATQVVTSPGSVRDNAWHYVAATLSLSGMKLYVDGKLVAQRSDVTFGQGGYWGYWRIGGDNLSSWPSKPSSNFLDGSIDEVAIYHRELSAAEVSGHYNAGKGVNVAPTARFTPTVTDLSVAVDGSASSDVDGTIASYAWTFGDGGTASGPTASHTYAGAGSYDVTLTVTDDDGATHSVTHTVLASAPNVAPTARFTPTVTDLSVAVNGSASSDVDGTIASYAWTFGDGGTASGPTASHTYAGAGSYDVTLTVTDDDGATHSVTHTVVASAPNVAPTARFTPTVTDLSVAVDGSASSDVDGTIASYAWTFGDGGTASGPTPSHTYAGAGSYDVTLTVTDDDGATGSTTSQVTVTRAVTPFALDSFGRTLSGDWGTADLGGVWTRSGSATNFAVTGGVGTIRMGSPGAGPRVDLKGISSTSTEVRVKTGLDKAAAGGPTTVTVEPRVTAAGDGYFADIRFLVTGDLALNLGRRVGTVDTVLKSTSLTGLVVSPGEQLNVKVQAAGTSPTLLQAKVWKVGTAEPVGWTASVSDSAASLQTPGALGLATHLAGSATNAPVFASFDELWAGPAA